MYPTVFWSACNQYDKFPSCGKSVCCFYSHVTVISQWRTLIRRTVFLWKWVQNLNRALELIETEKNLISHPYNVMFIVYMDILTGNLTIKLLLLTIVASTYIWVDSSLEGVSCSCSKGKHYIIYIIQSIIDFQCYIIFVHHTFITSGCWRWDMSMSCSPQTKINHNVLNVWAKSVSRSDYILHMQWLVTGGSLFFIWIPICLHEVISSLPGFLL